jgi:tetratricopeptide (TPR) repeat protein
LAVGQERQMTSESFGTISVSQMRVPEKARGLLLKAKKLLLADKAIEARKKLDKSLVIMPDYPDALAIRACLKLADEDTAGALEDADRAIELDPNVALAQFASGAVFNRLHRFDDAVRTLSRCVQHDPTGWPCELELAKSYLAKQSYAEALQHANRAASHGAVSRDPDTLELVRGYALVGLGQYESGVAELNRYVLARPGTRAAEDARKTIARAESKVLEQHRSPAILDADTTPPQPKND